MNFTSPIKDVSAGNGHLMVLLEDGSVWCIGNNSYGQCGANPTTTPITSSFIKIKNDQNVDIQNAIKIAAGDSHSLILLNTGEIYSFGSNPNGQLGNGDNTMRVYIPQKCIGIEIAKAISAGYAHSLVLLNNGTVKSFGSNAYGQLGNNSYVNSNIAVDVTGITNATYIKASINNSIVLLANGDVYICGVNNNTPPNSPIMTKMSIVNPVSFSGGFDFCAFLLNDGTVQFTGLGFSSLTISNAKSISSGKYHVVVLSNDDTVWSAGRNSVGQFGDNTTTDAMSLVKMIDSDNAKIISAGAMNSYVLFKDGTLKGTGYNGDKQLNSDGVDKLTLVTIATSPSDNTLKHHPQPSHGIYVLYNDKYKDERSQRNIQPGKLIQK